mgnify:CR=1 FL=1
MNKDCDKSYFKKPEFYRLTGGNNYVRIDAEDKVTGHGKYVGDIMFPDMLTGRMVRSPYAYARIKSIDVSEAAKLPGVKCILTAKDFEWKSKVGNGEFAAEFADKEVLCSDLVKQVGDDVAAVAAISGDEDAILISAGGIIIRIPTVSISKFARPSKGVRVMRTDEADKVVTLALTPHEEAEQEPSEEGAEQAEQADVLPDGQNEQ